MAPGLKFLFAVLAVLAVAGVAALLNSRATAQGGSSGGGGDANRDLIAVTGTYGSGASVLYLIDTRTRHMAVYKVDNGRKLELVAARNVTWDLNLETYNDQSEPGYGPRELRRGWSEAGRTISTSRPSEEPAPAPK
jgi:hypothetical protein